MPHSEQRYLYDMHSAAKRIAIYVEGQTLETYLQDSKLKDAVERCFELIGEAMRQAIYRYPELASQFPERSAIIGLRNIIAHEYGAIDDARVFWIAHNKVPELLVHLDKLLEHEQPNPSPLQARATE